MTVKIKTITVTNPGNVLVQIPKWIVELWSLEKDDELDMQLDASTNQLIITKKVKEDAGQ